MRKLMAIFLLFLLGGGALFASSGDFALSVSGGVNLHFAQYRSSLDWQEDKNYPLLMGESEWRADLAFSYAPLDWLEIGASAGFENIENSYTDDYMFTLPVYIDVAFIPKCGIVSFPITLSGGAYWLFKGNMASIGPAARVAVAAEIAASEHIFVFLETQHELLFTIRGNTSDLDIAYHISPVNVGLKFVF